jgi:hypothetical protein
MSAGAFTISKYECEETGGIHPIKIQPETLALELNGTTNAAPTGAIDSAPSAQVSRGKRSIGINARTVTFKLTAALSGYKQGSPITLPWLKSGTAFNALKRGQTGTYLATAVEVIGKSAEKVN